MRRFFWRIAGSDKKRRENVMTVDKYFLSKCFQYGLCHAWEQIEKGYNNAGIMGEVNECIRPI